MHFKFLFSFVLAADLAAANVMLNGVDCSYHVTADGSQTCDSLAAQWGMSVQQFESLNPGVNCPTLVAGQDYCVLGSVETDKPATTPKPQTQTEIQTTDHSTSTYTSTQSTLHTTTTTSSTTTSTTTTTSSNPYSPTQSGTAKNCNEYYMVKSGDQCNAIEKQHKISAEQFFKWNPAINKECTNLWVGYYVCVSVPGAQHPTPTPTNSHSPTQSGIAANCDTYHKVASGDQKIEDEYKITADQFFKWNPSINRACNNLWAGYYVCVHVPGLLQPPRPRSH